MTGDSVASNDHGGWGTPDPDPWRPRMSRRASIVAASLSVAVVVVGVIWVQNLLWPLEPVADRIRGSGDPVVAGVRYYQPNILNMAFDGGRDNIRILIVRGTTPTEATRFWC